MILGPHRRRDAGACCGRLRQLAELRPPRSLDRGVRRRPLIGSGKPLEESGSNHAPCGHRRWLSVSRGALSCSYIDHHPPPECRSPRRPLATRAGAHRRPLGSRMPRRSALAARALRLGGRTRGGGAAGSACCATSGGHAMTVPAVLNAAGKRCSPSTMPGYHAGRAPQEKQRLLPSRRPSRAASP